jgi:hypothetical protein
MVPTSHHQVRGNRFEVRGKIFASFPAPRSSILFFSNLREEKMEPKVLQVFSDYI